MLIDSAALTRLSLLKAIRKNAPVSRVELAEMLGLSKGAISAVTAELIESGLVSEEGSALQDRGRPRVLLRVQNDSYAVAGASIDPLGYLELCLVDLTGNLIAKERVALLNRGSVEGLIAWIAERFDSFLDRSPFDRSRVTTAAVAVPGVVESSTGLLQWFPTLDGEDVPAASLISERIGLPVIIENDVDCLARAEHWFGDDSAGDFTIVYQGLSVGLAQYSDGLPRTGVSGANAEFGHVKTDYGDHARSCFCGARGCLTTYSSYLGFFASSPARAGDGQAQTDEVIQETPKIIAAASAGDSGAVEACRLAGHHLGLALADYINTTDPRLILVRTADSCMPRLIKQALEAAVEDNTLPPLRRRTTIEIAAAQADWRWKGTAALALEQAYLGKAVKQSRQPSKKAAGAVKSKR